ncbi:MAG TPA: NAD(P)H-dependent oxidoreductase subunit E, partial [Candidatus Acidoferrum sp.]|nr:NAD(P)H-dependent oxidoreductase subunit E [Candidatus Acidoferrum sp.]
MNHDLAKLPEIFGRHPNSPESLIMVLQDIQKEYRYLPCEALVETAKALNVPISKVFSVATFYNAFSLNP